MTTLVRDLRLSFRMLLSSPGFSAVAVLAFALGIGANTAIFSVVNAVLLRPLAYSDPERLVVAEHAGPSPVAPATFLDWKQQATSFEQLGAAQAWGGSLHTAERPEAIIGIRVTANMFSLLGVQPMKGRSFAPTEDREDATPTVVLAHSLWQRSFGGAEDIIGRQVSIDGTQYNVIGVMPPSFRFAPFWITNAEMWSPLVMGERKNDRRGSSLRVFGRLKSGTSLEQAQAEMSTIMANLAKQYPDSNAKDVVAISPLRERVVGSVRPMLLVLLGTVSFVLLIACANVANLMLARATARRREVAVRLALGATRWQLARQSITESSVLGFIGGAVGLTIAYAGVYALNSLLPPGTLPRQQELGLDSRVLLFSIALSVLTGMLAGLIPAIQSARGDVNDTLKEGGRGGSHGLRTHRTPNILVVTEMALAFVLLIGAGLMLRSFAHLLSQNGGFDPNNLLSFEVSVSGTRQADAARRAAYYREVIERVSAVPGVSSVSAINHAPLTGDVWGTRFRIEGRAQPGAGEWPTAVYRVAYPRYFATLKTSLVQGRDFTTRDDMNGPLVVIVNEALARKYWPNEQAVGKRIAQADGPWLQIVGVVQDLKQRDWHANPTGELYFPLLQSSEYLSRNARHYESFTFVARTYTDVLAKSAEVRAAVESIDPNVLVSKMISMDRAVAENTWRSRLSLALLGAFGLIALLLAITGIYGVISHAVSQRTHEIGIRMAVGAAQRDVLVQSLLQGLAPVSLGIVIGVLLAIAATRLMSTMLYGVKPTDPLTFAGVAGVMFAAGLFASFWPALRAARVNPLVALRHN